MVDIVKYNNIEYFMPFLFCNDIFIPILDTLLKNEINPIKYVYGSPYCKWSSGARPAIFKLDNLSLIEKYIKKITNKYNLIPTFTFTNMEAKDNLFDEYSNELLDIAYKYSSSFIVSTEGLYNHIKMRYPDAKMHCSVLQPIKKFIEEKDFNETKFYNEMLDKYEIVVARPEYIIENIDKLDKLLTDISRIEVLINQYCHFNCPHHMIHYKFLSEIDECNGTKELETKVQYYSNTEFGQEHFSLCPKFSKNYKTVYFTKEQVQQVIDIGVKKIKLQGRSYPFNMLFQELYNNFFNNEFSEEKIRGKIDKICSEMLENNKKAALLLCI